MAQVNNEIPISREQVEDQIDREFEIIITPKEVENSSTLMEDINYQTGKPPFWQL